jgi:imidazolonepropionase-like amidohydrolase
LPLICSAQRVDDVAFASSLAEEFDIRVVILGGAESWMMAKELAENNIDVLYGPIDIQPSNFERLHARTDAPLLLHQAGVRFAFRTGANHTVGMLPTLAGLSVAHGLPFSEAIASITTRGFEILGLEAPNSIALDQDPQSNSFFLCAGDPLQPRNKVLRMWIEGREVSLKNHQRDLYDEFSDLD